MELKDLKATIPYKWRVQSFSKSKPACQCVAYIDARQVMDLLDSVCDGEWASDFKEVKGNLYAGIGIKIKGDWVWKWDCGTESQTEKEKGEASDSFKRAAVKWGVGRFLYSKPIVKLPVKDNGKGKYVPFSEKTQKFVTNADQITQWCNSLTIKKQDGNSRNN